MRRNALPRKGASRPSVPPTTDGRPAATIENHAELVLPLSAPCACVMLLPALCCPRVLPLCWLAVVACLVSALVCFLVLACCCCLPCLSLVLPLCLFAVVAALVLPLCLFSLVEFCRFGRDAGDASGFFSNGADEPGEQNLARRPTVYMSKMKT